MCAALCGVVEGISHCCFASRVSCMMVGWRTREGGGVIGYCVAEEGAPHHTTPNRSMDRSETEATAAFEVGRIEERVP